MTRSTAHEELAVSCQGTAVDVAFCRLLLVHLQARLVTTPDRFDVVEEAVVNAFLKILYFYFCFYL